MWKTLKTEFREQVWDSEQILKLRQKFAELDTQTQSYILIGSFGAFVLFLLLTFFTLWGRAISVKNQIAEMDDNLKYVQSSSAKIEELRSLALEQGQEPLLEDIDLEAPVLEFLERAGQKSLIGKSSIEISSPKNDVGEIKLSRVSLTQIVRLLYIIEKSGAGSNVEQMQIDAKDDTQGYLWATLLVRKKGSP